MAHGDGSERIREFAWKEVIAPQVDRGARNIRVAIKPLMKQMESKGFPKNRPRQFCTALQKQSFLENKGLRLEGVDGPSSGTSTTVVLHFAVVGSDIQKLSSEPFTAFETPAQRVLRLADSLRGLMKEEIAAYGGGKAYLRWVRGEDEDAS